MDMTETKYLAVPKLSDAILAGIQMSPKTEFKTYDFFTKATCVQGAALLGVNELFDKNGRPRDGLEMLRIWPNIPLNILLYMAEKNNSTREDNRKEVAMDIKAMGY